MKTAALFARFGLIFSAFVVLLSYFFSTALFFTFCIVLIIIFIINAVAVFGEKRTINFDVITILLFINSCITFFITTHLLGDFQIEKEGFNYIIKSKSAYIGIATLEEYSLYKSRISRLIAAYLLLFFHILYKTATYTESTEDEI